MKRYVVLGIVALMFLGMGPVAHAYEVSVYVSNGATGQRFTLVTGAIASNDESWCAPLFTYYVAAWHRQHRDSGRGPDCRVQPNSPVKHAMGLLRVECGDDRSRDTVRFPAGRRRYGMGRFRLPVGRLGS